jgi:hypothetical protein
MAGEGGVKSSGASAPAVDRSSAQESAASVPAAQRSKLIVPALLFVTAVLISLIVYLLATVPGSWFPDVSPRVWKATDLQIARGTGEIARGDLMLNATDDKGLAVVSVLTHFRATDYPAIAWTGVNIPEDAEVHLLWRTDYAPRHLNSARIEVKFGHLLPVVVKDPAWAGTITAIALAVQGPLSQPLRLGGVVAKPMGALEVLDDRLDEWLAFERWTGTSINTITGGADVQGLPLPMFVAIAVTMAAAFALLLRRWRPEALPAATAAIVAAFFLVAWLVLDARWAWNLARQVKATATQYAGKSWSEKREAADDGPLFDFVQKALGVMPSKPVRVIVASGFDYFRGRAAYHLYPHNAYFERGGAALPPAATLHAGDWVFVYWQRGIQFDASEGKLRWDEGQSVSAELKLVAPGAALFLVR